MLFLQFLTYQCNSNRFTESNYKLLYTFPDVKYASSNSNLSSRTKLPGDVYGEELLKIHQELLDIEREKLQVEKEMLEKMKSELVIKQQRHQVYLSRGVTFTNPG